MQEKHLFEYSVIRLVPCVDRGEFINVGVILYCPDQRYLRCEIEMNEGRVLSICPSIDLAEAMEHLAAFKKISEGGDDSGPIGSLPVGERFRWLTAPRSTIVQTSPVHTGICTTPAEIMEHLLSKMVR